eukprot:TRINITY_DN23881_c0_g1_i1.p1 TRINITY_DN23881_c0_g1~~TRINITY_DN23881_c0_g1_i1.p1  ORF type:complete len:1054 (-),score=208.46 TRINITY_DN23881_c0_g1_i1:98-3259(-)
MRPVSRGGIGRQHVGGGLPMVRTASAGAGLGESPKGHDLDLRPRRRQSFSNSRDLQSSQSAPWLRLAQDQKEIARSVSNLRQNMRQKTSKRGFRADLACTVSLPNRRPVAPDLLSEVQFDLTGIDADCFSRRLQSNRQTPADLGHVVLERAPGEMSPVRLTPKERNRLIGVSALEPFQRTVPSLGAQTGGIAPPLRPETGGAQCSDFPAVDAFPPPPSTAPAAAQAANRTLQGAELPGSVIADENKQSASKSNGSKELSMKPTDEMRKASRAKNSHSKRKATLGFNSALPANALPAPDTTRAGPLFPSVKEALDVYYSAVIPGEEKSRWKIAFARFAKADGTEIERDVLHVVLSYLGFLAVTEEKVDAVAKQTTEFSTLDFSDFADFCERWVMYEREALKEKCQAWFQRDDPHNHFSGPVDDFQSFMRSFNIACSNESVQDIMELAGLSGVECSSPEVLVRFLAGRRARLGFTAEEMEELKEAFDECEQAGIRTPEGHLIKADEISNGLLGWAELYCVEPLRKLLSKMEGSLESDRPIGCSFYEFVACAGQLREMMLHEVFDQFQEFDTDSDGYIAVEDLRPLCKSLGFNLVDAEFNEFSEQEHIAADSWLDFDVCWKFIVCVREAHGFTEAERQELTSAFASFCDESGEMPNLAVMDLLDHIGFDNTVEEVMAMVEQVDFNGNGTMDSGEFMRLMRIQRELSLVHYRTAYDKYDFSKPDNAEDDNVAAALTECQIPPDLHIMEEAIRPLLEEYNAEDDGLSFESFSHIAETCRRLYPVQKRKRAYFKEEEAALIKMAFAQQDSSRRGYISVGDLVWLMADSGLPVNTKGGRAMIFAKLDQARESARSAGVDDEDVGNPGSPRVRCMPVVHLVRDILKQHRKEVDEKVESIMKGVKFSGDEIAEFRKFFDSKSDAPPAATSSPDGPKRRRSVAGGEDKKMTMRSADQMTLSKVLARFKHVPRLPVDDVLNMSQNSALQVSSKEKLQLSQRIMKLAQDGGLDFASFVQVMQWMLDSNYGNVKATDITASGSSLGDTQDATNVRQSRLETRRCSV